MAAMTSTPRTRARPSAPTGPTRGDRSTSGRGDRATRNRRSARSTDRGTGSGGRDEVWTPDPTWLVLIRSVTTGAFVALLGLAVWLVVTLGAWILSAHGSSSPTDPLRLAVALWAWSNHAGMTVSDVPVRLTPLGLIALPIGLSWAGGRHLARLQPPGDLPAAARVVSLFALGYTLVATVVVVPAAGQIARVAPASALVWAAVLSFLGGAIGVVRGARLTDQAVELIPATARPVLVAGTGAALVVVAAAAVLAAVCLAAALPETAAISQRLHGGVVGGGLVALLGMAFVPNLVAWVAAVLVGPGFAVGAATEVSPRLVEYGPLPAFPPVAALPPEGVVPPVGWLVLLLPLAAGVLAGLLVARRVSAGTHQVAALAAASGLVTGGWLGGLAWLSAGGLGVQRLTVIGPAAGRVGLTAALEVGLVAAVTAWEAHRRGWGTDARPGPDEGPDGGPDGGPDVVAEQPPEAASRAAPDEPQRSARRFAWRNVWPVR